MGAWLPRQGVAARMLNKTVPAAAPALAVQGAHAEPPAPVLGPGSGPVPEPVGDGALLLSVVVPTFNEADNVESVTRRLHDVLDGIAFEIIFVDDDSDDGTASAVRAMARQDLRVRCVHRVGRRGLSSACIEGMMASSAPFIAVMDADLQHDETILPLMLDAARSNPETDLVVASRYADGGSLGALTPRRRRISAAATRLSRMILKSVPSDPMSGFFLIRREAFDRCVRRLSGIGFKILLDVLASSPRPLRLQEVAYTFRDRARGESKLDTRVAWDFVMLLLHKLTGTLVPVRFLTFSLVGGFGIVVHFAVLYALFRIAHIAFDTAQGGATLVAMTSNYVLNNTLTYRDMRLTGWAWLRGWVTFCLGCSLGALANVGIASYLFQQNTPWGLSALVGVLVGAVWNYAVTSVYTWKRATA